MFALSYGSSTLGMQKSTLNNVILIVAVLSFASHGLFALLSARIGRRPVYFFGAAVVFVMAFPFFAELFPTERRYTGAAAGREIASILSGGLTPFIATALAGPGGTRWWLVAGYVMLGALITMIAVAKAPETLHRDL
ncbi:hypothetical protein NLX83_03985 [Allokutzneria sp. A3M-2-11 16]|uniref:hypothetical protein n=1 Tax=Allokutzneria sp. A3M-2-11 16 TaxID=2962043 RepID=UPI0020B72114|nr:hypothetical protein [Allokutzneria sp. A3M-2-11 16]MCP3798413.1 hypothetical protein [Allokutzneria sp. A3M-2-11 16]